MGYAFCLNSACRHFGECMWFLSRCGEFFFVTLLFISNQNQIIYNTYKIRSSMSQWDVVYGARGTNIQRYYPAQNVLGSTLLLDHMAIFAWAVSSFLHPLSWWLIGFYVPVIAGNVCLLFLAFFFHRCYAEVCMERLVRDLPWRALYRS